MKKFLFLRSVYILMLTAIIYSCSNSDPSPGPSITLSSPTASAATAISQTGFTATWSAVTGATDYRLDVSADNFATFVSGYNNKTVTGTTDVVSGLTAATPYKYRVRASNSNGASTNSNEISVTTSVAAVDIATINGQPFVSTSTKATDTGSGLDVVLADNNSKISLSLEAKTVGTYQVINNSTGRVKANDGFYISVLKDGVLYSGVTGNLVLTSSADGTVSATFDATLKSSSGVSLTVTGGKFVNISIGSVPSGCKITSITYSNSSDTCDSMDDINFFYNSEGKISRAIVDGITVTYNYDIAGKLIGISAPGGSIELTYSGSLLTSFKETDVETDNGQQQTSTNTYTFSYSGNTLTTITRVEVLESGAKSTHIRTLMITNGNITEIVDNYSSDCCSSSSDVNTTTASNFDEKKNPFALLAQLSNTSVSFFYGGVDDFFQFYSLNANNPANETKSYSGSTINNYSTYSYTYNAQNYPTKIVYTYGYMAQCVDTITILYSGCQ